MDDIRNAIDTAMVKVLADAYLHHMMSAPCPDRIKMSAFIYMFAMLAKSADYSHGIKLSDGRVVNSPAEMIEIISKRATEILSDLILDESHEKEKSPHFVTPNNPGTIM